MPQQTPMSIREFEQFCDLPGNEDRLLELIDGVVVETDHVPTIYSQVPHLILFPVHLFCGEHSIACHTSGALGAYDILGHVITPKFAYKPTSMSKEFADPNPPLWVAEVVAPTTNADYIRRKREIYQEAGILLWEVYDNLQKIDVYAPGQPPRTVGVDGTLDGGDVLPGFTLAARALFAE